MNLPRMHAPDEIPNPLSRRAFARVAALGAGGGSLSHWLPALAARSAAQGGPARSCILLWMPGGPSQLDTFDPKAGHANAGPLKAIETSVPGIFVSEHLPKLARRMEHVAVLRSMSSREGDHARAMLHLRTGYAPSGPVRYPTLGSLLSKELGSDEAEIPNYVSIASNRSTSPTAFGPGYLGPRYAPLEVGASGNLRDPNLTVANLDAPGVSDERQHARQRLWHVSEDQFNATRPGQVTQSHREAYLAAQRLMRSRARGAFELEEEPPRLRDDYGRNQFGQGCLLARRLVERGVPFVEVALAGVESNPVLAWDTHFANYESVRRLCDVLDAAWATLLDDLAQRGLLASTLVVWMGEFGRTPQINRNQGRDHYPQAWSTVLCGGGVRGGQVIGGTTPDGMQVQERPIKVADLIATICRALDVDPMGQNMSNVGRPIRLADPEAQAVAEALS
jgi:hypothetical protein